MAACGVEGIEGATLSGVLTAPVFGFQDAIGVCLFVMILGGFLGIITETGALELTYFNQSYLKNTFTPATLRLLRPCRGYAEPPADDQSPL